MPFLPLRIRRCEGGEGLENIQAFYYAHLHVTDTARVQSTIGLNALSHQLVDFLRQPAVGQWLRDLVHLLAQLRVLVFVSCRLQLRVCILSLISCKGDRFEVFTR